MKSGKKNVKVDGKMKKKVFEEIEPTFNEALRLRDSGKPDEALLVLNQLNESYPDQGVLHGAIAGVYYTELNDYVNAVKHFEIAVECLPHSRLASLGLFHSLLDLGEKEKAISELERFLQLKDSTEHNDLLLSVRSTYVNEE